MADGGKLVRQHLIDPISCVRCDSCRQVCPNTAITAKFGTLVINAEICDGAGACIDVCETGAISSWRLVHSHAVYSIETQAEWEELPPQENLQGEEGWDESVVMPAEGHGPPASAAAPQINKFPLARPAVTRVVRNDRATPESASSDIHHLVFDASASGLRVLEGQSIGVLASGADKHGNPHAMRLYSVASARDGENRATGHIAFTVKRVVEDHQGKPHHGVCSNYICDLRPGEEVRLVGPFGSSFLMPDDPEARIMMICTGTGVAPMRGIIERRRIVGNARADALLLFYGGRTLEDLPYYAELSALHGAQIDLVPALSRVPGKPREYVQDALLQRQDQVAALLSDPKGYVYLCGLKGMEDGVLKSFKQVCTGAGLDWEAIHEDMKTGGRLHIETY